MRLPSAFCAAREMRREHDGVRMPPMPKVFWFCTNVECADGKQNRLYSGG